LRTYYNTKQYISQDLFLEVRKKFLTKTRDPSILIENKFTGYK